MKTNCLTRFFVLGVLCSIVWAAQAQTTDSEARQTLRVAIGKAGTSLAEANLPADQGVSIWMPQAGRWESTIMGELRTIITAAGLRYVERTEEPFFDEVMRTLEQTVRKGDLLDTSTKLDFGKLKQTRLLMYGIVRSVESQNNRAYAELELHISELETMQHLWGGTFIERAYFGPKIDGIVDLDANSRTVLQGLMEPIAASLQSSPKLTNVRKVMRLPLAGDINGYMEGIVEVAFSGTEISPVEAGVSTRGEARALLIDKPELADAILTGSLRGLWNEVEVERLLSTSGHCYADLQLSISDRASGEILWSHIGTAKVPWEIVTGPWTVIVKYRKEIAIVAGALLLLIVVGRMLRAFTRATGRVR